MALTKSTSTDKNVALVQVQGIACLPLQVMVVAFTEVLCKGQVNPRVYQGSSCVARFSAPKKSLVCPVLAVDSPPVPRDRGGRGQIAQRSFRRQLRSLRAAKGVTGSEFIRQLSPFCICRNSLGLCGAGLVPRSRLVFAHSFSPNSRAAITGQCAL